VKRHRGGRFDIRFLARALAVAGTALAVSVCGEGNSFGGTTGPVNVNDATGPVITVIARPASLYFGAGDTIRVLAKAVDPSGIAMLGARLFVLDTVLQRPVTKAGDSIAYTSRQVTRLDSFKVVVPASLAPGAYRLHVFAVDSSAALNDSTSDALDVQVRDVRKPGGTFNGPALDSQVVAGDTLPISFRATDNVGVVSVRFRGYGLRRDPLGGPPVEIPRFQPLDAQLPSPRDTVTIVRRLVPVFTDSTADSVLIEAKVTDVGGNDTIVTRRIRVVAGPSVTLGSPAAGTSAPVGVPLRVIVTSYNPRGLDSVGVLSGGAVSGAVAVVKGGAPQNSVDTLALTVPATAPLGTPDTITPYYVRSGVRMLGRPVVVSFVDLAVPTVTIQGPTLVDTMVSAGDSVLVQFRVQDNRGVTNVTVEGFALRGDSSLGTATEVPHFGPKTVSLGLATDTTLRRYLIANSETRAEPVYIRVTAADAAPNTTSALRRIRVVTGASVRLLSPAIDTTHAVGNPRTVTVNGYDPDSVKVLGFVSSGAIAARDSTVFASPLGQSRTAALSLPVPGTTLLSTDTITPFVIDGLANRTWGASVVVTFQDLTPPQVTFVSPSIDTGVVFGDSVRVTVRVRDNALGTTTSLLGRAASASGQTQTWFSSVSIPGLGSVDATVARYLPAILVDPAGALVYLVATATDAVGNSFTDSIRIQVTSGPYVRITEPTNGTQIRLGQTGARILPLVEAFNPDTILYLGYAATGRVIKTDSIATTRPLTYATTLAQQLTLVVPDTTALGTVTLTPFVRTKSGRLTGPAVSVELIDGSLPVVRILSPVRAGTDRIPAGDSLFVRVAATDDRELASLQLEGFSRRPDVWPDSLGQVNTVRRFETKTVDVANSVRDTVVRYLNAVLTDSTAENAYIIATATDKAGNRAVDTVRVVVTGGSYVRLTAPAAGARPPIGNPLSITVRGFDADSVRYLGFVALGVVAASDSVAVALDTGATRTLSLLTTTSTPIGNETIAPFLRDRLGNRIVGGAVTVTFADTIKPTVTIDTPAVALLPVNVGDSVYVRVRVTDNRGVTQVVLTGTSLRGSAALGTDTTVTRFVSKTVTIAPATAAVITRYLLPVPTDSTSEAVTITATATDSSGNTASGTATVRVVSGPVLTIVRPVPGTLTSAGKTLVVEVQAHDPNGVRFVGYRTTGVVTVYDTLFYSASAGVQPKTVSFVRTLNIPNPVGVGTFAITPFAEDSLGDPSGITPGITVTVQDAATDITPPAVTFAVSRRIEATDSITVSATDASGIGSISWSASLLGTPATVYGSGTTGALPGTSSDVQATFGMNLAGITRYPTQVVVVATATSGALTGTAAAETLTVVAGRTFALPGGSSIGDAIYNPNLGTGGELYLSNTALNRIEVFDVATSSFVASIPVGSRPVGLALWPSDTTTRANADTLIVANSGGTNLSIVDLVTRVEKQRYRLPNYIIQKVKAELDPATSSTRLTITEYDYSDRPQYVAAVCRSPGPRANCGHVIALFSTTPTPGQVGYPDRGYLAWENLTSTLHDGTKGHFFWEQAAAAITLKTDTLQIIAVRDSVPGTQVRDTILGAGVGQIVDFDQLQFQDSTFVRNSGNYLRALVGEGGTDRGFARVMAFAPTPGTVTIITANPAACATARMVCTGTRDLGISEAVFVRDFIANRASRVTSIAINQNGLTMLVRADSIYAFNQTLGQTGVMRAGSGAVGMDFHPSNDFNANTRGTGGAGYQNSRLVFAARPDSSIDVFDTFFYGQVTDLTGTTIPVPIRNSLIGPVRAATYSGNTVLFGLTAYGLVKVTLPIVTNSLFPVAGLRPDAPTPAAVPRIVSSGARRPARDPSPPRE